MSTQRKFYLHLIDGRPGYWSDHDKQIVLMEDSSRWRDEIGEQALRTTLLQVRRDQVLTQRNRKKWGFDTSKDRYGYALVTVPTVRAVPSGHPKPRQKKVRANA